MEAQRLSALHGWLWIKQGYALFMKAPLLWIVLLMICLAAAIGLSVLPVVGEPLLTLLMPAGMIGLMYGCRMLERGEELELAHLFSGFQRQTANLIALGGISLVSQFLIFGLMMLAGGAALVNILMSGQPDTDPAVLMEALTGAGLSVLIGIALFSLLTMAMQYAPMLVFFNSAPPVAAMQLSVSAFIRNIVPMLVYVVTYLFLAILASLPMFLGWLVLLPLTFTSLYASYRDIFPLVEEKPAEPPKDDPFVPGKDTF